MREPERAFEDLRALLFDAAIALLTCPGVAQAQAALEGFADRRFAPLLHHYQLSNWILYARAYAARPLGSDAVASDVDRALRQAPVSLDWLDRHFIEAAVTPADPHRADALADARSRAHRRRRRADPVVCSAIATRCASTVRS